MKKHELVNNQQDGSFEFRISDEIARIDYARSGDAIALTHTEISPDLRGQGIGTELVESVLEYIDGQGMKVIPLCGFVIEYIQEHPEWKRIVVG